MHREYDRMTVASRVAVAVVLAYCVGCGTKRNEERCLEGLCSDPSLPFCDLDGRIGGTPNSCIAVDCMPGEIAGCRDDRALTCNTAGDNYDLVQCPYGCDDAGCKPCNTSDCEKHIIPKYLPNVCNELSAGGPITFASQKLDTSAALSCSNIVPQSNGPEICVYRASSVTIPANQTLRVVGTRALALVADRDLSVSGTIDVSAETSPFEVGADVGAHGPGGGIESSGMVGSASDGSGTGGAGFRDAGGAGGDRSAPGGAANGGAATTNPALLTYVVGGSAPPRTGGIRSGFAGGAIALISCRGTVSVTGIIDANGGGGSGGYLFNFTVHVPAGGGGSGGTVVIQGMNAEIMGQLFANGGGGGAGEDPNQLNDSHGEGGQKGKRARALALGGIGANGGGAGGAGGATRALPELPGSGSMGTNYGGAGGGSTGFIQTFTPETVTPVLMPAVASPELDGNRPISTN